MKSCHFIFIAIFCTSINLNAQGTWTQLSNFSGGNREISFWFEINNYGYLGGGRDNGITYDDLWQYNPITDSWTQMATKPGGVVFSPGFFVIGDTAYIVSGWDGNLSAYQTVWAYLSATNSWVQKNNFPGASRYSAIGFALNNKGYFGTGYGPLMDDFWEYAPATDSWTQLANCPGGERQHATAVASNGKAYFGLGYDGSSFDDWWEFDPLLGNWSAKASFPGGARRGTMYFEMNGKIYVAGGYDDVIYYNDLWEYNPLNNSWTNLMPNMPAAGRYAGFGFGFNGCAIIGTGSNDGVSNPVEFSDVWKYCLGTTAPIINFQSTDSFFCEKQCIDFVDLSTNNPTSWEWHFNGAIPDTSTLQNPTNICYNNYGHFNVTLIACNSSACDTLTIVSFINEFQNPVDSIWQSNDTLFSLPASTYQWYEINSGIINGATNQYFVTGIPGSYYCVITDSIGCEATSNIITATSSPQLTNGNWQFQILPNPNNGNFEIVFNQSIQSEGITFQITDVIGQIVFSSKLETLNSHLSLGLKSGIYFAEINSNGKVYKRKLVINN